MIVLRKERISSRNELKNLLKDVKNETIDMSNVKYLSISAAHELLTLVRENNLKLINLNEEIEHILKANIRMRNLNITLKEMTA